MASSTRHTDDGGRSQQERREAALEDRDETPVERLDRNTTEMVSELRVGAVGVQVLFAFLLVVPFNKGWAQTTEFQHVVYYVTLVCIALATVLLIAPSIQHRVLFRQGEKPYLVRMGNRMMIGGMVFQAAGLVGIFVLISDFVFSGAAAAVAGTLTALIVLGVWFGIPLWHRARM